MSAAPILYKFVRNVPLEKVLATTLIGWTRRGGADIQFCISVVSHTELKEIPHRCKW